MLVRRDRFATLIGFILISGAAFAQQAPSASIRMNELGLENLAMAMQVGTWDVTETVWDAPGAVPVVTKGLTADRRMIGSLLQETIQPAPGSDSPDFRRIDYLSFNRVEGRWEYVSMDTRAPVGIMPAWSFGRGEEGRIVVAFQPFAIAGSGPNVTGQMLRMDQVITRQDADHDLKEQRFVMADGDGVIWLAHQYAYARR